MKVSSRFNSVIEDRGEGSLHELLTFSMTHLGIPRNEYGSIVTGGTIGICLRQVSRDGVRSGWRFDHYTTPSNGTNVDGILRLLAGQMSRNDQDQEVKYKVVISRDGGRTEISTWTRIFAAPQLKQANQDRLAVLQDLVVEYIQANGSRAELRRAVEDAVSRAVEDAVSRAVEDAVSR